MYLLPNQKPEGPYLKILSGKRISLLRVNISNHCSLFGKAISTVSGQKPWLHLGMHIRTAVKGEGMGLESNGFRSGLCLLVLKPRVTLSSLCLIVLFCKMEQS